MGREYHAGRFSIPILLYSVAEAEMPMLILDCRHRLIKDIRMGLRLLALSVAILLGVGCTPTVLERTVDFDDMVVMTTEGNLTVPTGFGCQNSDSIHLGSVRFAQIVIHAAAQVAGGMDLPPGVTSETVCMITDVISWTDFDYDDVGELMDACARGETSCRIEERYQIEVDVPRFGRDVNGRERQQEIRAFLDDFRQRMSDRGVFAQDLSGRALVRVIGTMYECGYSRFDEEPLSPVPTTSAESFDWVVGCASSATRSLSGSGEGALLLDSVPGGLGPDNWCDRCQVCRCAVGNEACAGLFEECAI